MKKWNYFGQIAKISLALWMMVAGVPAHAREYSLGAASQSEVVNSNIEAMANSLVAQAPAVASDLAANDEKIVAPWLDEPFNQFGIIHVNALAKRIEMVITF